MCVAAQAKAVELSQEAEGEPMLYALAEALRDEDGCSWLLSSASTAASAQNHSPSFGNSTGTVKTAVADTDGSGNAVGYAAAAGPTLNVFVDARRKPGELRANLPYHVAPNSECFKCTMHDATTTSPGHHTDVSTNM